MVATLLNNIQPFVYYEGCTFQLSFICTQYEHGILAYIISDVEQKSKHYDRYTQLKKWLPPGSIQYVRTMGQVSGIRSEMELRIAITKLIEYVSKYGIDATRQAGKVRDSISLHVRP